VHTHQDSNDKQISKYHLRDLICVNRYTQHIIWEAFSNEGLFIDVFHFQNAEQLLNSQANTAVIRIANDYVSQSIKFAEASRPDDGVPQYLNGASDGTYAVGYEDGLDGTASVDSKFIRFYFYYFVEHASAVKWLAQEAQLDKVFDVPGIVSDISQKLAL